MSSFFKQLNKTDDDFRVFQEPIRSEIYSATRLESQAEILAHSHLVSKTPRKGHRLGPRISANKRLLEKSYLNLIHAVDEHRAITPAAEWLIDNFHIVRAQLKDIRDLMPREYYQELPKLLIGPLRDYPRVYGIAWYYVAHTDSHFDADSLKRFLFAYQKVQPLTIGELWALPITLRVVLIENLRRLAARIVGSQEARQQADQIADEVLGLGSQPPRLIVEILAELERIPFSIWLAVQLLQRLRFQDQKVEPLLKWLDQRLEKKHLTSDTAVTIEHGRQTAANATVRNIITSARLIAAFNWQDFFEEVSLVDQILRQNPFYSLMDFATRDRYRHSLEHLARHSPYSQIEIAHKLILLCEKGKKPGDLRSSELGYYLISKGRKSLEKEIKFRLTWMENLNRGYFESNTEIYLGGILFVSLLLLSLPILATRNLDLDRWQVYIFVALGILVASEVGVAIINRVTVALLGPKHLPRIDLEKGIPESSKTFVVVPTFLNQAEAIDSQLEQLEIHYLSNPEGHLHFALLTDWVDATTEYLQQDRPLLNLAAEKLKILNSRYPPAPDGHPRFHIFHRKRLYNPQEKKWIAWERKRGKLHEFNRLLLGAQDTSYIPLEMNGPIEVPSEVRYVITLDADTKMPKGCVAQLVGTMAHPLNEAFYDDDKGRVTEGYGILQPRITPTLPSTQTGTLFQFLSASTAGVDPYASAVSDVYQDLFNEGSYTGKGIYNLRMFERALEKRIPENSLLSHDLFEGNYARCGFLSDVEFFEDFPGHCLAASLRTHRWMRGDWQLLPWILGRGGASLSTIGRWKMADNLRRSLFQPAAFFLLIFALATSLQLAWIWGLFTLLALANPPLITFVTDLFNKKRSVRVLEHLKFALTDFQVGLLRTLFFFLLLPYYAWLSGDAILRTLFRLFISKKYLLEWIPAAQAEAATSLNIKSFFYEMRGGLILTAFALPAVVLFNPPGLFLGIFLFLPWLLSPWYAYWISRPFEKKTLRPMTSSDQEILRLTGRRIWLFFASFVKSEDHFLPPDNFQEEPHPVIAHRSSPTNFGLYLLSVFSARSFGWITLHDAIHHLSKTLESLHELPKYNGHFYNWYETTTLRPLDPKYISSVDNGNLAGHLIAVAQGFNHILSQKIDMANLTVGVYESLELLKQALSSKKSPLLTSVHQIEKALSLSRDEPMDDAKMKNLKNQSATILQQAAHSSNGSGDPETFNKTLGETLTWAQALHQDIVSLNVEYHSLLSWFDFIKKSLPGQNPPEILSAWKKIQLKLSAEISLEMIPDHCAVISEKIIDFEKQIIVQNSETGTNAETRLFLGNLLDRLDTSMHAAKTLIAKAKCSQAIAYQLFNEMDFRLLYDKNRKLFSIGYRVFEKILDPSYYDLLASEARLLSFVAIAKGDVPVSHWFSLGRSLAQVGDKKGSVLGAALVSWSGSMFEYLMPSLVMKTPEGGLIKNTCELVIHRQIAYGKERSVPWGISESAYNKRDLHLTYQYSNFGIPDLALKRGLGTNIVVAPYATLLAAMYEPSLAAENLRLLKTIGACGTYGYYEALDYTRSRVPTHRNFVVIRAYMAHHQGMSLVSLANVFYNELLCRLFHNEPLVQATEILLQERTPRAVGVLPTSEDHAPLFIREDTGHLSRRYHSVNLPTPRTQILSNGNYTVILTSAGSGYSQYQNLAVTRWREDVTQDPWGSYIFIKDLERQKIWSPTYQPLGTPPEDYEVTFAEDRVLFHREEEEIESELEIFVSPENNAEIRQLTLTNKSEYFRNIELTSYAEIVLNTPAADMAHPAFSNLFLQTEYLAATQTLLVRRRPRSSEDPTLWAAHVIVATGEITYEIEYETDRAQFLGRGRTIHYPQALFKNQKLSKTVGAVLDPIFSLRTRLRLEPGTATRVFFSTLVAESRKEILRLAESFQELSTYERVSSLAWSQAQVKLHYLNMEPDEAHLFQRLATRLLYLDSSLRPSNAVLKRNTQNITHLWAHGISGDFPVIVVRIEDAEDRGIVRQLLKAQEYLALKRFVVDLVILNAKSSSYSQELQETLESMVHSRLSAPLPLPYSRGKVFILREEPLPREDRLVIYAEARITLSAGHGSLSDQINRMLQPSVPPFTGRVYRDARAAVFLPPPPLEFFNGLGGFTPDGREYVIVLNNSSQNTPAPWINVISNGTFGFQVSESGSGFTWSLNSRENQITSWSNDPVCDPSSEAFYIYDLDSKCLWTPTALPIRLEEASYIAAHGQGYSRFEHLSNDIHSTLTQFVPFGEKLDSVKVSQLRLENRSEQWRRLSLYAYVEWTLGFLRSTTAPYILTEIDEASGALFATNVRNSEYGHRVSFAIFPNRKQQVTGDRREFIGRNRNLAAPLGILRDQPLSNHVGAALDPCGALQIDVQIGPGEVLEVPFFLGQAANREEARSVIFELSSRSCGDLLKKVSQQWDEWLEQIQIETPDKAFNFLLNRWLPYQNLSCRYWARSAFYQAGGAFGFRDQLQDMMATVFMAPQMVRAHLLRAASRQFIEGDVQHWWFPSSDRGVRTHFSDDLLWLPFATFHYVEVTGDLSVLDEIISFLEAPLLKPEQEDAYDVPVVSAQTGSLYEHCVRALERSMALGAHGLPLMGGGDWNDGMNRVGKNGKGESVWLGWFLYLNLQQFSHLAQTRNESARAEIWLRHADQLKAALEREAWDGDWYRRAFYDDGTPLGTAGDSECRIDSLAQTWAVISGAADLARARHAMQALDNILVRRPEKLVLLFHPPFDKTPLDPGYIKGYVPGVRENGAQYTHAAAWCVIAWTLLGDGERALELFNLLNPINHALSPDEVRRYKIEPYVLAGDVYSQEPHIGRGGWSWYTGSAGWMYRAALEYILGFRLKGQELFLTPQISPQWRFVKLRYKYRRSVYAIHFVNPEVYTRKGLQITLDGTPLASGAGIPLKDDEKIHQVVVTLQ
ncbi:MAG TPA: glucoamylase family protein [Pseudobdellovibrionaceae bacterium]